MAKNAGKESGKEADAKKKEKASDDYTKDAAKKLTRALGTKVSIKPGKDETGRIEIEYYSLESLNALIDRLK